MSALGESFRTARESQGISLADAADRIHIRSVYLAAIESEDWQAIGQPVYVRGFIRNYARFLGLDPDAAVAQFSGSTSAPGAPGAVTLAPSPRGEPSRSGLPRGEPSRAARPRGRTSSKKGPSAWAVLGVIIAVVLVGFVGYQYLEYRQAESPAKQAPLARTGVDATHPALHGVDPLPAARMPAPELRAPGKNTVRSNGFAVALKDSSWLRVVVDGKVVMEGLFAAGTARSFSGRSVTVRVGNAGGVDVTVNGKNLGPLGGLGDVAERSFQL